jgi:hypothetical protein
VTSLFVCGVCTADNAVEYLQDVSCSCDESQCLIAICEVQCDSVDTGYNANAVAGVFVCPTSIILQGLMVHNTWPPLGILMFEWLLGL